MNEKYKAKLAELKTKVKKHAPTIIPVALGVGGSIGWYLAGRYKREINLMLNIDLDAWPTLEVHPELMENLYNGSVLKVRSFRGTSNGGNGTYIQMTTEDDFSDEFNERLEAHKEEVSK